MEPDEQPDGAKLRRAQKKADRQAAEREQEAAEEAEAATYRATYTAKLAEAERAVLRIEEQIRLVKERQRGRASLADHLSGFYEEIDKLAKGKALLEVTPLVLAETNQTIRDAKAMVAKDPFLDRVREFVPAGNNPVYPDVVVALRTVRQSLDRAGARLAEILTEAQAKLSEAVTFALALDFAVAEAAEPSLTDVKSHPRRQRRDLSASWFTRDDSGPDYRHFDIERFDQVADIERYLHVDDAV
ncbi:MAG: hypothetical protein ABJF01_25705 [bacterium]